MTTYNVYVTLQNNAVQVQVNPSINAIRRVFSVRDYGAVGDGVTDDTTAVQNCLNAAKAAGAGEVLFTDGTFLTPTGVSVSVSADTSLPLVLRGNNAQLKTNSAVPILTLQDTGAGNLRRITVKDLTFNANNAGATGIKTRGLAYSFFQNVDFLGSGTAMDIGSNGAGDLGLQGSALRFTGVGRAILLNATRSVFTNVVVSEGITGLDVFNIGATGASFCVIDGFYALASGGSGGTAGIVINTNASNCVVSNGTVDSSYTDGIFVGGGRNNKVLGVGINSAQGHGLTLNGALQGRFDVSIQNASSSGVGNADCVHMSNTCTDCFITASFVGTNPAFDINETTAAISNCIYVLRSLPNGNTIASSSSIVFSPANKATITGALSTVTDAAAKAVLTSIIAALTAQKFATSGTT